MVSVILLVFLWKVIHYDTLYMLINVLLKMSFCPHFKFKILKHFLLVQKKSPALFNTLKSISLTLNKQNVWKVRN